MTYDYKKAILYFSYLYQGDWNKMAQALDAKTSYHEINCPYSYVTIVDSDYPDCFKELRFPPWILYYCGHLGLLANPKFAIVGSRKCSKTALENTHLIVERLKKRYTIVSGLAKGVDQQAHWSAIDHSTIGIIGCGIDQIYPKENHALYQRIKTNHLLLSEYPPGTPPYAKHFPWRNRLIAAACKGLIVIEATYKSGTMITVNECLSLSRSVYCLPTSFNDHQYPGCNALIESGARMLLSLHDVDQI